mmetsp:Transcript_94910/g.225990  ORF Transcript_94910/g.225990 Transcript_94910/m.225990 type:complete len:391 (-) Transcript_94910:814-1986(-)
MPIGGEADLRHHQSEAGHLLQQGGHLAAPGGPVPGIAQPRLHHPGPLRHRTDLRICGLGIVLEQRGAPRLSQRGVRELGAGGLAALPSQRPQGGLCECVDRRRVPLLQGCLLHSQDLCRREVLELGGPRSAVQPEGAELPDQSQDAVYQHSLPVHAGQWIRLQAAWMDPHQELCKGLSPKPSRECNSHRVGPCAQGVVCVEGVPVRLLLRGQELPARQRPALGQDLPDQVGRAHRGRPRAGRQEGPSRLQVQPQHPPRAPLRSGHSEAQRGRRGSAGFAVGQQLPLPEVAQPELGAQQRLRPDFEQWLRMRAEGVDAFEEIREGLPTKSEGHCHRHPLRPGARLVVRLEGVPVRIRVCRQEPAQGERTVAGLDVCVQKLGGHQDRSTSSQ